MLNAAKFNHRLQLPLCLCIATAAALSFCVVAAQESGSGKAAPTGQQPATPPQSKAYLGMRVADLDPGTNGQGILVEGISPDSPAAAAGIRELDLLMTYDDQKLFSRNQLVKLTAMDQPGREVTIRLIRDGKQVVKNVRLGDRPTKMGAPQLRDEPSPRTFPQFDAPGWLTHRPPRHAPQRDARASWEQFESLTIKQLEKDRFRVTLNHFDANRKLIRHEYSGSRDELREFIDADMKLEPNESQHLLRSLDLTETANRPGLFADDEDPES